MPVSDGSLVRGTERVSGGSNEARIERSIAPNAWVEMRSRAAIHL
jgi:hypothetical protein